MSRPTKSAAWIAVPFILIIGLILWVGVLSMPGAGSIVYVAAVIVVTTLLAYADRRRNASRKRSTAGGGRKGHRDTAAR